MNSTDAFEQVSELLSELGMQESAITINAGTRSSSTAALVAAGSAAAVLGYITWEQIKFRLWRAGKNQMLPGETRPPSHVEGSGYVWGVCVCHVH